MYNYNMRNFERDFPQLNNLRHSESCLILDNIFNKWTDQIPNSTVSDIQRLQKNSEFWDRNSNYICVVDGKIVNLKISGYNVSDDEDEHNYKAESIGFGRNEIENKKSGYNLYHQISDFPSKDEIQCEKLFKSFSDFVKNQKLEELVTDEYILKKLR